MQRIPHLRESVRFVGPAEPEAADLLGRVGYVMAGPIWGSRVMVAFEGTTGPHGGPRRHWIKAAYLEEIGDTVPASPPAPPTPGHDDPPPREPGPGPTRSARRPDE